MQIGTFLRHRSTLEFPVRIRLLGNCFPERATLAKRYTATPSTLKCRFRTIALITRVPKRSWQCDLRSSLRLSSLSASGGTATSPAPIQKSKRVLRCRHNSSIVNIDGPPPLPLLHEFNSRQIPASPTATSSHPERDQKNISSLICNATGVWTAICSESNVRPACPLRP